jgi:gamma-glutamyltranspeptidase/glutathione hydrolase
MKVTTGGVLLSSYLLLFLMKLNLAWAHQVSLGGPESVSQSRYQPMVGTRGMVVSDDREASIWGAEILRQGGNAVDAAVAVAFALAVTRPHYAALGGGGFFIYCPKPTSKGASPCQSIDYREQAPAAAHRDLYIRDGKGNTHLSQNGALASGVPGVTAGLLLALQKFGTFPRQKLLTRPIELARKGYIFSPHSENAALERWKEMNPAAHQIFGCGQAGKPLVPCPPGTRIKQLDLAKVLQTISKLGRKGFYEGWVAQKLINGIRQSKGIITLQDLKAYEPKFRDVVKGHFQDYEIISMGPPSSGGSIVVQLLEYADRARKMGSFKDGYESAETLHALAHSMALAFADRAEYMGDPDFVKVPLATLLSSEYLDQQWKSFQPDHASLPTQPGNIKPEPQHTTHFSVIDRDGNAVSITTTVNDNFGSGFVPPGTGIVMNNQMDDFSIQPGVPNLFGLVGNEANSVAAGKRPLSSMSPTIVRDSAGNARIVIGAAGGPRIISSVFLSILNRLQFGMSLTDAVAAPRIHHQWKPEPLRIERYGFSAETKKALKEKGYQIEEVTTLGKVHALESLMNGRTLGVQDPRGEGAAVPE